LIKLIYRFKETLKQAAAEYSPGVVANYVYDLSKEYSTYYQGVSILKETDPNLVQFRLQLSKLTAEIILKSMNLLGIQVPERM
jgi:arginyl-tRNA synthetase